MAGYDELKAEAKELGINTHNKNMGQLTEEIAAKKADVDSVANSGTPEDETPEEIKAREEEEAKEAEKAKEAEEKEKEASAKAAAKIEADAEKEAKAKAKADREALKGFNAVIVLQGKREIRRYTKEKHGKEFGKLAGTFAKKMGYSVEPVKTGKGIKCPNCGHKISTPKVDK